MDTVDAGLSSRTDQIVAALQDGAAPVPLGAGVIEADEAFAQVLDADGSVVDSSPGLSGSPLVTKTGLPAEGSSLTLTRTVDTSGDTVPARLLVTRTDTGNTVVVGASLEDINEQLASLIRIGAVVGVLAIAVTAGIGWVVAGVALRPVEAMRVEAEQMSADDLHRRLVVPGTRDELSRLADTLNSLIAEIDAALTRERAFIGQASHEMRTPLANLKAEVDLALRRPRGEAELRTALVSVGEEVDRLSALANGLLDLARLGQGQWALRVEVVDPHSLVEEEVQRARARAGSDHLDLRADCRTLGDESEVRADPQRLRQVISNLLDNAISHSPDDGAVFVTSEVSDGWTLRVVDEGPGFPPGDLESLTRPFGSGAHHGPGSTGLGLSIVSAIVEAHGGSLHLENAAIDGAARGAVAVVHIG